jgi:hypothetical protein
MSANDSEAGPATRAVERVNRILTWGKLAWLAVAFGSGGIGTGVGFLLGEGAARATFEAKWSEHDRRIQALEISNTESAKVQQAILGKLEKLEGSLDVIKIQLLNGVKNP